jgi:DNA topoisomerase VI subunit B
MLIIVLFWTKYGNTQSSGKFGIGAKMALIWSKISTGVPIEIFSSTDPKEKISYYLLEIDTNNDAIALLKVRYRIT